VPSYQTLIHWVKYTHSIRYGELREKAAVEVEERLVHDYRDIARQAAEATAVAIGQATVMLEKGKDLDPARTASNLAKVATNMTDKMLSLSGRPTSIREDRNVEEILRSLAAKGIIELPSEDVQEELPAIEEHAS
jgi:hypothetical protein